MTALVDHADEARRLIGEGERVVVKIREAHEASLYNRADDYGKKAMGIWAQAQVHATLALVEQQRIANLIALAGMPKINGFENEVYDAATEALMEGLLDSETVAAVPGYGPAGIEQRVFIRPLIAEALGLS